MENSLIKRVTKITLFINIVLSIVKFVFGYFGKSTVLIADSVHSLGDSITDIAILIGVKFWSKPPDKEHQHGHNKIELIVTLFISILLFFISFKFLYSSISNIIFGIRVVPHEYTLYVAIISIVTKELLYRWTIKKAKVYRSSVLIANAWHHRSDALSSVPVFIAILLSVIHPSWAIVDSIGTIIVSIFLFQVAYKIAKEPYLALTDYSAPRKTINKVKDLCKACDEISNDCNIRSRYLGSNTISIELIIKVDGNMSLNNADIIAHKLSNKIKEEIREIVDVFIHVDPE